MPKKQGIVKRHIKGELHMFQGVILWKHGNMHSQTPHTVRVEKKTQPTCFVFLKEIRFFLKKTEKPHPELFSFHHAISHNITSSLLSGKAWQACAQQIEKNHSHTHSAVSRQVYVHVLLVQHL